MKYIEKNAEIKDMKDGFFDLEKDKEALALYMEEISKQRMKFSSVIERFRFLVANDFYYDVFEQFTEDQIVGLYEFAHSFGFEFQSFMAAQKFYNDYALRTNDKKFIIEDFEDRALIVALYLSEGVHKKAKTLIEQIVTQNYQPATPTFLNAGRARRGEMVSCFLTEMDDSLNSINYNIGTAMQLSKIGGGVALNLGKLRGRGESIKGIENAASGVVPVMKLLEDSFAYANQLGQRKGAGATYLNIFHWDIIEYLDTKKINADEKSRIQSLSIGLVIPNRFYKLCAENEDYYVFAPLTVYQAYGVHLDDMDLDLMYDELVQNPMVKKKKLDVTARDMLVKVAAIQLESGYPYLFNKTNTNRKHANHRLGTVKMSNLCTEIMQLQETSTINDYGIEDEIRRDISCNLGSLNIVNVMENKQIKEAVFAGMEALTSVSTQTKVANAPGVKKANDELHSVGLGAMNLHGFLAKNYIAFESEEAKDFVRTFFMMMNFYSLQKSMEIAREKEETYKGFELSDYATGEYFDKYVATDYRPQTEKVQNLFEGIEVPTKQAWKWLRGQVKQYGLFNAYRLAIAPTQSISYLQNATASIQPIVSQIETRTYANATTYFPMPFLNRDTYMYYMKTAYDMDQRKWLDLVAEIQEHVDQGISTILFVNSDISTKELASHYIYAAGKGLKSLYYTRTRKQGIEDCIACSI